MNLEPTPSGVSTLPGFMGTELNDWVLEMSLHQTQMQDRSFWPGMQA
jgi:hypothetical protein